MNTGLQDAANLAWKLALVIRGRAPTTLLDTYHTERWPIGQKILQRTDRLFAAMSSQTGWLTRIRNIVVPFVAPTLAGLAPLRRIAFHFVSQLGIRYHASHFVHDAAPTSGTRAWRSGVAAGQRAPDAGINGERSVFDLLQGYRFHVLALSRRPLDGGEIARLSTELEQLPTTLGLDLDAHLIARSLIGRDARFLQAESPEVFAAYGVSRRVAQALFLVRPDGYVAYRAPNLDVASVAAFLRARFTAA
jgi:hypothetical protein